MKSNNSQFFSIRGSYFSILNMGDELTQGTYNKTKEKISMLEF